LFWTNKTIYKRRGCQDNGFGKKARSINKGMITGAQGFVSVHNNVQQATQIDISNLTTKTNKQEVVLPEVCTKSFCWPSFLAH
jgi:hypothetical protein